MEFRGKDGEILPIVNHRHENFSDVPDHVRAMYASHARPGRRVINAHADKLMDAYNAHFEPEEVVTHEAIAFAFFRSEGEAIEKKALFNALNYLVRERRLVRRTRGYYQRTPKDYIPEVKELLRKKKEVKAKH